MACHKPRSIDRAENLFAEYILSAFRLHLEANHLSLRRNLEAEYLAQLLNVLSHHSTVNHWAWKYNFADVVDHRLIFNDERACFSERCLHLLLSSGRYVHGLLTGTGNPLVKGAVGHNRRSRPLKVIVVLVNDGLAVALTYAVCRFSGRVNRFHHARSSCGDIHIRLF